MINPFKPGDIVRTTRGWGEDNPKTAIYKGDLAVVVRQHQSPEFTVARLFRYPDIGSLFINYELELVHEETD